MVPARQQRIAKQEAKI